MNFRVSGKVLGMEVGGTRPRAHLTVPSRRGGEPARGLLRRRGCWAIAGVCVTFLLPASLRNREAEFETFEVCGSALRGVTGEHLGVIEGSWPAQGGSRTVYARTTALTHPAQLGDGIIVEKYYFHLFYKASATFGENYPNIKRCRIVRQLMY